MEFDRCGKLLNGGLRLEKGFLGLMSPPLFVDKEGMLKVVRSAWSMPELKLPGFKILFASQSDAPIWGASKENFGQVAVIEVHLKGTEKKIGFAVNDENSVELHFTFESALAYVLAILAVADDELVRKFSKVAYRPEAQSAVQAPVMWAPPRFVWLRVFEVNEAEPFFAQYLFDRESYPEFDETWLEDPLLLLNELEEAAELFSSESEELFDSDGIYIGERIQPKWMRDFNPKN